MRLVPTEERRTFDWRERANCTDADTELFFPADGMDAAEAKALCRGCEVRESCLHYALTIPETKGIWGGTSERERRRMRRARRAG